jgi:flagellum-specific ATP synthase
MTTKDTFNAYCFPRFNQQAPRDGEVGGDAHGTSDTLEQKLERIECQAYEEGFAKGRDERLAAEKAKLLPMSGLLSQAKGCLQAHQTKMRALCEEDTVRISLAIAREIVHHELDQRPDLADAITARAVEMAAGQGRIKVKAHPADGQTLRNLVKTKFSDEADRARIQISDDAGLIRGGCLIETEFGVIDARIDQQLAVIAASLAAALTESKAAVHRSEGAPLELDLYSQRIKTIAPIKTYGHVTKVVGLVVEANGPMVQLGTICDIHGNEKERPVTAEVLGFRDRTVLMMPLEDIRTIGPGSKVVARQEKASVSVGDKLLGRIIDGLGNPIDGRGPLETDREYSIYAKPINPLLRQRIRTPLDLGIRAINGLLSVGCGQRMGIFAGSGVGKSVLMGMIARKSNAHVNVIALIGERGRELNDFIEKELGEEGLKKSVVVVATSDHLPLVRVRGAFVATAIAEYFRDQGMTVNLMMDSLTRFAMAQREIGLALGEPPTTKGYTPSVFTLLPKILERAGTSDHAGSITGLYTVLVEGDDMNEPIADAARSILDGHIVLSRDLAHQNHYPAIDVLRSISRVMEDIATLQHKHNAGRLKELLATYRKAEDLINIGAYVAGSNPAIDRAVAKIDQINGYLRQNIDEYVTFEESLLQLEKIMNSR